MRIYYIIVVCIILFQSCNTHLTKIDIISQKERIKNSKVRKMVVFEYKFNHNIVDTTTKRIQQIEEYDTIGNILKTLFFFNNTDFVETSNTPKLNNQIEYKSIRGKDTTIGVRIYNNDNNIVKIIKHNNIDWKSTEYFEYKNRQLIKYTQTDWNGKIVSTTNNKFEEDILVEQTTKNQNGKDYFVKNKYSKNNNSEKIYTVFVNSNEPNLVISEFYENGLLVKRIEVNSNSNIKEKRTEIKYNKNKLKIEETIFENNIPNVLYKYTYST